MILLSPQAQSKRFVSAPVVPDSHEVDGRGSRTSWDTDTLSESMALPLLVTTENAKRLRAYQTSSRWRK